MSQTATWRAMDAMIVDDLLRAGLADSATYTPPGGGAAVACDALVDRAVQFFDAAGEVAGRRVVGTLFLAQVPSPVRGALVVVDGESFRLDLLDLLDESMSRWVVVDG